MIKDSIKIVILASGMYHVSKFIQNKVIPLAKKHIEIKIVK